MLYFAYGSNMDFAQMRSRCPSAKYLGNAMLPDHRLAFTRRSINRRCGVSDVVLERGRRTWGTVFEIAETEIGLLDKEEGYRPGRALEDNSYVRRECHVFRDGDAAQPLLVAVYFGNPQPSPPLPNGEYKKLLVEGARFWHLPPEYVAELESIRTSE